MKFAKSIALVAMTCLAMFVASFAQQVQTDCDHRSVQVAPAAEHGTGETVTPNFEHAIPNIPGKSLVIPELLTMHPEESRPHTSTQTRPSSMPTSSRELSSHR